MGPGDLGAQAEHASGFGAAVEVALSGSVERARHGRPWVPIRWLDLGSGGGLPGLVLADRWPGDEGVLLDASARSVDFLTWAISASGYDARITVRHERAEVAGRDPSLRASFDVVVARSFGSPPVVAECAAPFLRQGGVLVVSEPPVTSDGVDATDGRGEADPSPRWPAAELAVLGLRPEIGLRIPFGYQALRQVEVCTGRFPRRVGIPAKRPLYRLARHAAE